MGVYEATWSSRIHLTDSMEERDTAAVSRARAGDAEAFRALVERHSRSIFRLAHRMTGNEHDAEDVVQETFLRAHRQIGRFEERANFSTWLYRIGVNCSLDLMRRRRRRDDSTEPLEDERSRGVAARSERLPDDALWSTELRQIVSAAMEALSPLERSAFVLRHYEGMSIDEIGRVLGLRANATKHSIFRAVRKMRQQLRPLMEGRVTAK
jgi:RNA polymerase sigma-70 factor (ECF subfamily)